MTSLTRSEALHITGESESAARIAPCNGGLEMVGVRQETPRRGGREHVVGRQRVASNVAISVQRMPAHRRERRSFTKLTGVDRDRREARVAGIAIRIDDRQEVIMN